MSHKVIPEILPELPFYVATDLSQASTSFAKTRDANTELRNWTCIQIICTYHIKCAIQTNWIRSFSNFSLSKFTPVSQKTKLELDTIFLFAWILKVPGSSTEKRHGGIMCHIILTLVIYTKHGPNLMKIIFNHPECNVLEHVGKYSQTELLLSVMR